MNSNSIMQRWLHEGMIKKSLNTESRFSQEKMALQKLKLRKGYLAEYDSGIRYMQMYLLNIGYDLEKISVHYAFRMFLQEILEIQETRAKQIISERHKLKYENNSVSMTLVNELRLINQKISELLV